MEKISSFDRVVGKVSENEKKVILQKSRDRFGDQRFEELKGMEREKTPRELQMISLAKLSRNVLFVEEIKQTSKIMNRHSDARMSNGAYLFDRDAFYAEIEHGSGKINTENFTYVEERKILSILIDKLFERNGENFKNKEDVFEMFSKAMMTGNILPIGKLIDKAFGVGVFRRIGELDENIQEQYDFIRAL